MDRTLESIFEEIGKKPLRASVITAAALLDTMLEKVISAFLIPEADRAKIFDYSGCMGTFSAKIEMAYALGLISKELRDDLNLYRKIRNDCAHTVIMDEKTEADIKSKSGNFSLLRQVLKFEDQGEIIIYTALEFMVIFTCLIKRYNNLTSMVKFPCEVHDDHLGFTEEDYKFLARFGDIIRK